MNTALTLQPNQTLTDISNIITTYRARNPLLEKFENTYEKFALDYQNTEIFEIFDRRNFYKLSQVRGYIEAANPYKPRKPVGEIVWESGFCSRCAINDPLLTKACLTFLYLYYGDCFESEIRKLWMRFYGKAIKEGLIDSTTKFSVWNYVVDY